MPNSIPEENLVYDSENLVYGGENLIYGEWNLDWIQPPALPERKRPAVVVNHQPIDIGNINLTGAAIVPTFIVSPVSLSYIKQVQYQVQTLDREDFVVSDTGSGLNPVWETPPVNIVYPKQIQYQEETDPIDYGSTTGEDDVIAEWIYPFNEPLPPPPTQQPDSYVIDIVDIDSPPGELLTFFLPLSVPLPPPPTLQPTYIFSDLYESISDDTEDIQTWYVPFQEPIILPTPLQIEYSFEAGLFEGGEADIEGPVLDWLLPLSEPVTLSVPPQLYYTVQDIEDIQVTGLDDVIFDWFIQWSTPYFSPVNINVYRHLSMDYVWQIFANPWVCTLGDDNNNEWTCEVGNPELAF